MKSGQWFVASAVLAILVVSAGALAEASSADQQLIQGKWQCIKTNENAGGEAKPKVSHEMVFKGADVTNILDGNQIDVGTFGLDQVKSPREIDLITKKADEKNPTIKGIYKIDGDTLVICLGDKDRPKDFTPAKDNVVMTFERVKAAATQPTAKP